MSSGFAAWVLDDDDKRLEILAVEARFSLSGALTCVNLSSEESLSTFNHLKEQSIAQSRDPFSIAIDENIEITSPLAALMALNILLNWESYAATFYQIEPWFRVTWKPDDEDGDARILDGVLKTLSSLSILVNSGSVTTPKSLPVTDNFHSLARQLEHAEKFEEALACAVSAANFASGYEAAYAEDPSNLALSLVRRVGSESAISGLMCRHAHLMAQIAVKNPTRRVDAFDSFEVALRQLAFDPDTHKDLVNVLESWIHREPCLKPLSPLLVITLPLEEKSKFQKDVNGILTAMTPIWKGEFSDWFKRISYVRTLFVEIANARLALLPQSTEVDARAVWSTWGLRHRQLRHAIPMGSSILKEEFLHKILLELSHEVTHVYSMYGSVGVTLVAMRWALFEAELDILAQLYNMAGKPIPKTIVAALTTTPLKDPDLILFAFAERAVEIERKIQILENTWAPWFEGLAVIGELAADPEMDPDWESPVASTIFNLLDRNFLSLAEELKLPFPEVYKLEHNKSDALYADAIRSEGKDRLRTYLTRNHRKYLAGYLACRSVVAAWRSTLEIALRGDQAFRILLHMTRYSEFEAIPDLGLPLDDYQDAVIDKHLEWVRAIASASAQDLNRMLGQETTKSKPTHWRMGRLVDASDELDAEDEQARASIERLATQSLSSLVGERASADRVEDADEVCRAVMEVVAEALTVIKQNRRIFSNERVNGLISRYSILPLGQVSCPFWLLQQDHRLACLIRTRESDIAHGNPSYDLLVYPLEETEYAALEERVARRGARQMLVTRVVDLAGFENRVSGSNFIVFQFDDWMFIQPVGSFYGVTKVEESLRDAIRDRLVPNVLLDSQEGLTGDDHPCAQRTANWIDANTWQVRAGDDWIVDISPWAERVRKVAAHVVSGNLTDVEVVSQRLLAFVTGDPELASNIFQRGFSELDDEDYLSVGKLMTMLDDSARRPLEDHPDMELLRESVSSLVAPLIEHTSNGWDVVRPKIH